MVFLNVSVMHNTMDHRRADYIAFGFGLIVFYYLEEAKIYRCQPNIFIVISQTLTLYLS